MSSLVFIRLISSLLIKSLVSMRRQTEAKLNVPLPCLYSLQFCLFPRTEPVVSRVLLICCGLLLATAQAGDSAALRFCYEDSDSYPWVMRGGEGLNIELLREVGEHLQRPIEFIAVPWRRCLAGLQQGRYDGAFAASYQAERALLGAIRWMPKAAWIAVGACIPAIMRSTTVSSRSLTGMASVCR